MRTVQEIFNLAIKTGAYKLNGERFMCLALDSMRYNGLITIDECQLAENEIERYLKYLGNKVKGGYLGVALERSGLPFSFEDRLKIYQNWENRPKPRRVKKMITFIICIAILSILSSAILAWLILILQEIFCAAL